jgi:multiple sugar transport system substrate-binding protein
MDDVSSPDFFDALVNAVAAGNAPDATHLNTNMLGRLIDAKVLADISSDIDAWDGAEAITPNLWQYVESADGSARYAVPNRFLTFFLYYRTDLLQAAGVEVPETQEEFVAASDALAAASADQYGFDIRGGAYGWDQWAAFLVAGGARFVNDSGEVVFDSDGARAANDLYISTYGSAPPGAINDGFPQIISNFETGTATMIINHLGAAKTLVASLGQDKVGAALIPSATGDPDETTYMGTMNMNGVLSSSDKKEAAFQWISYLAEPDAQMAIAKSPNGYLPVVTSVAEDPAFADDPYFQVSYQAAQAGTIAWPALPGTITAAAVTWQPLFQGALLGDHSNDDVVAGVAESLAAD